MESIIKKTEAFLQRHTIDPDTIDMQQSCDQFMQEMKLGLAGSEASLHMLPTYITIHDTLPVGEPVVVLDAGGTNFRTCTVEFDHDYQPVITNFRKTKMPGFDHEVSANEFFQIMADFVAPVIPTGKKIGFCFSYAAEITPDRDGRLLHFSKEIKAPEVKGKVIGQSLLETLGKEKTAHIEGLTLLNDTVATLLAAKAAAAEKTYSGYIGFILGTGTNTCYLESNRNITKVSGLNPEGSQIINVESGSYAFPGSDLDKKFYATTRDPGTYQFEKLISGAYLGPYAEMVIQVALDENLLSEDFRLNFSTTGKIDTIIMDRFLHNPEDEAGELARCCAGPEDAAVLYRLLDAIIERAGKLTAVNLSAAVLKEDIGRHPARPACINADGTTFYKTHNLKQYTECYLHQFLARKHGRYYDIISVDNAPILGAAIAGLMN